MLRLCNLYVIFIRYNGYISVFFRKYERAGVPLIRKLILLLTIATIMTIYLGTVTCFASERTDDVSVHSFMTTFALDDDDLEYSSDTSGFFDYVSYFSEDEGIDYSVYGSFCFSSGLERLKFSAFACEKNLVGYGQEDSTVGLLVYTEEDGIRRVLDSKIRTLGASGLFSDEIEFAYNELQYLVVAVKTDEVVYTRVYEVTTKEASTKSLLEHLEINFMTEFEENVVPEFDLSLMTDYEF